MIPYQRRELRSETLPHNNVIITSAKLVINFSAENTMRCFLVACFILYSRVLVNNSFYFTTVANLFFIIIVGDVGVHWSKHNSSVQTAKYRTVTSKIITLIFTQLGINFLGLFYWPAWQTHGGNKIVVLMLNLDNFIILFEYDSQ